MPNPSPAAVRRLALASLVLLGAIVVTGAAVRLTASGLGCPTWPRCTDTSFVAEATYHGAIEFGNRLISIAVGVVVLATLVAAVLQRPRRRDLVVPAAGSLVGVLAQGVLGGITVLTGLDPLTVAAHFLLSMVILVSAVVLHVRAGEPAGPVRPTTRPEVRGLVQVLLGVTVAVLALGTLVTGTGPHSGDPRARRLPFDEASVSQLHADGVFLLVGLAVAVPFLLRAVGAPALAQRRALVLLGVVLAQGAIGFVQYVTGLPVLLVGLHVLGAVLVWVAALRLLLALRERVAVPGARPAAVEERVLAGA